MDDVLAEEELGDGDPLGVDLGQHQHLPLGLVGDPLEVVLEAVVAHRHVVLVEHGQVAVQPLPLLGIGDHRVVLHADLVGVAVGAELLDRPLELPGGGVRPGEGEVPGDVVLEDRGGAGSQMALDLGQLHGAPGVLEDGLGSGLQYGDARFSHVKRSG